MTNEEAIKGLERLAKEFSGYKPNEEMFEMAINALTAQPETHDKRTKTHSCDLISRQAAIDAIQGRKRG